MPKKGYTSITLKDAVVDKLQKIAESLNQTIPKTVEILADQYEGGETG